MTRTLLDNLSCFKKIFFTMDDLEKSKQSLEQLNVGIVKYLEKKTGVTKINLEEKKPADRHTVLTWEQRNTSLLPEDLKSFYLTTNGFHLTWAVKMDNNILPVGKMHINPVTQLLKLDGTRDKQIHVQPSLADLEPDSDNEDEATGLQKPSLTGRSRIFELDPCDGYGKVCLVYKDAKAGQSDSDDSSSDEPDSSGFARIAEPSVEIWFLDRSLRWHFLATSFLEYYRLMLMHLGLPQWHYAFTDIGLSLQAKQWFNMYAPIRLEVDSEVLFDTHSVVKGSSPQSTNPLDVNKVFKGKSDRKKLSVTAQTQNHAPNAKKKSSVSSARSQSSLVSKPSGSSSSQGSVKGTK